MSNIEKAEEATLRDLLGTDFSAPRHLLYLELGILPAMYVKKQRKILPLKHILTQDKNSLLKKVFIAQLKFPSKGDWTSEVTQILKELNTQKTLDEIKDISKNQLSKIVKFAIKKNAFNYLISIHKQKQKGKEIIYKQLSLQPNLRQRKKLI